MYKKLCKKITSLILSFVTAMSVLVCTTYSAKAAEAIPIEPIKLSSEHNKLQMLQYVGGGADLINFGASIVTWTDPVSGETFPAYCVMPAKDGADSTQEDYMVTVKAVHDANDDPKVWGAINAGYPNNKYGLSDHEAYYATKMAIWHIVYYKEAFGTFSGYPNSQAVYDAFLEIYNKGMATTSIPTSEGGSNVLVTADKSVAEVDIVDKSKHSITYTVTGITGTYTVEFTQPTGGLIEIVDENNIPKTLFNSNEKFKVLFTAPNPPFDVTSNITVKSGDSGNDDKMVQVLYGEPQLGSQWQTYAMMRSVKSDSNEGTALFKAYANKIEEENLASLTIYKYSTTTKQNGDKIPLKGVVFELIDSNGHSLGSKATDASGIVGWDNLPMGWYQARELTNNGLGYQLTPPTYQDITLDESNPEGELTFYDDTSTTVTPHKVDAVTGEPIEGVEFEIHQIDGNGNWKAVGETGSDGTYSFENVPDGVYSIREVSTVSGYILDATPQTVVVKNGQATSVKFTNSKFPGLTITKVDSQTGETITKPAIFRATQIDGAFTQGVTTQNGIASLKDIPVGTYQIQEISAPEGFVIDPTCATVYLGKDKAIQYVAKNTKKPVLKIEKIDAQTGMPISGVKFEVKKSDGTVIGTVTTGGANGDVVVGLDGNTLLGYLDPDVYTITEIFVPEPYVIDPVNKSQTIRLNAGDTKTLTFMNLEMPIITIEKYDEKTGEKLPLSQFAIYEQADESRPIAEGLTDTDGKFSSGYVKPGTYVVRELLPPPGYMVSDKTKTERAIVAKAGDGEIIVKVDNIKLPELIIKKLDKVTQLPLAGFTFSVVETDDISVQPTTVTTDSNGLIKIPGLKAGTYTVTEIAGPSNYIIDKTPRTIQLNGGDTKTLLFENIKLPTLVVLKTDYETNKGIPNTTYEIKWEDPSGGVKTIGTYKTNAEGRIVLPFVQPGWYQITETIPAQGYQVPTNPTTRIYLEAGDNSYTSTDQGNTGGNDIPDGVIVASGKDFQVVAGIVNYPLNSIIVKKSDANTGEMLSGATFEIIKVTGQTSGQNGTVMFTATTDASGVLVITGLPAGAYAVREIKAPTNYIISETSLQNVNLKADGTSVVEVLFRNHPYGGILISKVDAITGKSLANAKFKVTNDAGAVVGNTNGEYITNENGEILIENIKPGAYVVTELIAPEHYIADTTPQTVNVGTDGKVYKVSFKNQPSGTLVIRKLDTKTKEPLEGAEFKVTTSSGDVVGTGNGIFTTYATGSITIPHLPKASYIIEETKAPLNYVLENQTQTIAIDYGKTYTVDFYNKKMSGLQIIKVDSQTKLPMKHVEFALYKQSGEMVGRYETDADGVIIIDTLEPGWYKVVETKTLDGYIIDDKPKDVEITANQFIKVVFENNPMSGLLVRKVDDATLIPLEGMEFTVKKINGELVGNYRTNADGSSYIPNLTTGWYSITETKAPDGYSLGYGDNTQSVEITHSKLITIEFRNKAFGSIVIKKVDEITGEPLAGAYFTVKHQNGTLVGEYTTGNDGTISISNIDSGWYVVSETKPSTGYSLNSTAKTIEVKPSFPTVTTFTNKPHSGIEIIKIDEVTKAPLMGASFIVERDNGEKIGTFKTDASGKIIVPNLTEGTYVVSETIAPEGYMLSEVPKTVVVVSGKLTSVEFTNKPFSGIEIIKTDAITHRPLSGATFTVVRDTGEVIGTYKTDAAGKVFISNLEEGTYIVSETIPPTGYSLNETPKTVIVKTGKISIVEFENRPFSGIEIIKLDAVTKIPLMGATFVVERTNGEKIGTFKTDASGKAVITELEEGNYIVSETMAPDGYMLNEAPKTVVVTSGKLTSVEFTNKPYSGIEIIKLNSETKAPLSGATFVVESDNGEKIGQYKTDSTGKIIVSDLHEGTYIVSETIAPEGFILDETPKTVVVKSGKLTILEFFNKPLAGLKIIKLNSVTRQPIEGVEFVISKMSGEKIENDFRGQTFITDKTGQIYIPNLTNGYYTITETLSANGYILDSEPKTVLIESGKPTILEVLNTPMSGLLIIKTDLNTGKPLKGVVFDVRRSDGSFVSGNIIDGNQPNTPINSPNKTTSPNGDITGSYTTDANGRIQINGLEAGQYNVIERKALDGYELDTEVHNITITPGKLATLQLTNKPKAGLRLIKIDSITKKPIFNVEFMLIDANNKVIGTYYTNDQGIIDFTGDLSEGRYTIRETRAATGYYLDETAKTVEFVSGKITEIIWTNTPQMGQIQITKRAGDDNEINSLPAGTPLSGAVFEVYAYKTGNLIDRFVSGNDGKAVSSPLPIGRYIVKEVQAPQYYKLSTKELDIEIEFANQIIKEEFLNYSANTGVYIKKTGNVEAMPGDTIRYDIKAIQNTSSVPLSDFFWRDIIPTDAVRLTKIVTGTYNQSVKYKIMATTNKGDSIIITDNLSSINNNVIDCSNASLGLRNDEYITSFTLVFGSVKAGFSHVEQPQIFVNVLKNLQNAYEFANKADIGGKYGSEWVISSSSWLSKIYTKQGKLPRTGY